MITRTEYLDLTHLDVPLQMSPPEWTRLLLRLHKLHKRGWLDKEGRLTMAGAHEVNQYRAKHPGHARSR